ncbi:hypothetical protein LSUE1_G010000 [Lachnellula suecica]|uniref:BRCT domain-containing protein n=1 Tax=Lachnellula suecica TaxID=602035 RepID=A0A8T9BYH8_9HELO|nr:hypothetical protein LSUE1_G010000 [Lachnellula suecica]
MNDQSPPKRVTRARAAAKTTDAGIKTTKIATAASKAKVTRAVSTTKRKTRADEPQEEEENHEPEQIIEPEPPKSTRGRPKRAAAPTPAEMEEEAPAPARATRGRPKRGAVETPTPELPKTTRARVKKIEVPEEEPAVVEEPPKRTTRTRAATVTKPAAPKKTVKFEEPDKENIAPPAAIQKSKAKAAEAGTGLRAKPVRKPATAATRATRGRAKAVEEKEVKSSPLSPKKATQVGSTRDNASEDELATTEKTPMKVLSRSPMKPPGSIFGTAKKLNFSTDITVNKASTSITQDLTASVMASPARRPPQSPFKETLKTSPQRLNLGDSMLRSPFKPSLPAPKSAAANTSFKASLLQSPARRPQSPTKVSDNGSPTRSNNTKSLINATPKVNPLKMSRFATPKTLTKSAVRPGLMAPPSAFKDLATGSPRATFDDGASEMTTEPKLKFCGRLSSIMPRDADPALRSSEPIVETTEEESVAAETEPAGEPMELDTADTIVVDDPAEDKTTTPPQSPTTNSTGAYALREEDENPFLDSDSEDELASDVYSPRALAGFHIASHDFAPATPTPFTAISKTPRTSKSRKSLAPERDNAIGFTPLARQLNDWMAASPEKSEEGDFSADETTPTATATDNDVYAEMGASAQPSPVKSSFFEDEMSVRDELAAAPELEIPDLSEPEFNTVELDDEDLELANEADEMSLLEPDQIEILEEQELPAQDAYEQEFEDLLDNAESYEPELPAQDAQEQDLENLNGHPESYEPFDEEFQAQDHKVEDFTNAVEPEQMAHAVEEEVPVQEQEPEAFVEAAPSEASQEYGDENAMPLDPALFAPAPSAMQPPGPHVLSTPKRVLSERVCHTVSKVPLKPAADVTPMRPSPKKRSASISRLPAQRPTGGLTRNNTVISYSPTKGTPRAKTLQRMPDASMEEAYNTPTKEESAMWSTLGTPTRTPHRDLNSGLLKGAIVFVDVHTTEGADASVLFTELLTQMGARCVKTWSWNGNGDDKSKIGITHVVFKDGGKRTLEKARETGGVVSCVGVGWVLDCERENKWLDEAAYAVDTAIIPRGGNRRRKSMEPRALANLNGTLVPSSSTTPSRNSPTKDSFTPYTAKSKRRESVQWTRSPSSSGESPADQTLLLSPLPATPAPETISAYGETGLYGDETPGGQTPYFLQNKQLVQQTAPPAKGHFFDDNEESGPAFLSEKKDESVMMRLMAARRKSLQWAPKVGSPLARGGQGW